MCKNYGLYAAAAVFMLLSAGVQADWFDFMRPEGEREARNSEQRPVGPGLVEIETESGQTRTEVKPLESLFGGSRSRNDRRDNRRNHRYDDYDDYRE